METALLPALLTALSPLTCVRRIDSFGSTAIARADEWSDLDLLVWCEDVERTVWLSAAAIRSTMSVAFYRPFTAVHQPSGRYWFRGHSPFHRLDLSFQSVGERAGVIRAGFRRGHTITVRTDYVAHLPADPAADGRGRAPAGPLGVTPSEDVIGRLLYRHLETVKGHLRGQAVKTATECSRSQLLEALASMPADASLLEFVLEVDRFVEALLPA